MKGLENYMEVSERCVRCGICKSVCPTYDVVRRENSGPRGRLSIIEARFKGEEGFKEAYMKSVRECTLCGACFGSCPNGVNIPELILAARNEIVDREGMSFGESLVFRNFLNTEKFMPLVLRFASKLQGLVFKGTSVESGLLSRFSVPLMGGGRLVPELSDIFFLDRPHIKELSSGKGKKRGTGRVGFYVGCGINYFLPDIGEATLKALGESGADVIIPQGQVCCGMPIFSAGDRGTAKKLAQKNLEAFEETDLDYIVTSCATCGHGLRNVFKELLSGESPELKARVEKFSSKVRDITELLTRDLPYKAAPKGSNRNTVVTYHDPCHLRRYQGITEEPRKLILDSGFTYRGLKHPCRCCGLGGGLGFSNYELSMDIAMKKAEDVKNTGADVVATACPGCIIQLKDALHKLGVTAKVSHVVELL